MGQDHGGRWLPRLAIPRSAALCGAEHGKGRKTRSVFDRYNIVSERDPIDPAKQIETAALGYRQAKIAEIGVIDEKGQVVQNETVQ